MAEVFILFSTITWLICFFDICNVHVPELDGRWPAAWREHHRRRSPRSQPESQAASDLHRPHNKLDSYHKHSKLDTVIQKLCGTFVESDFVPEDDHALCEQLVLWIRVNKLLFWTNVRDQPTKQSIYCYCCCCKIFSFNQLYKSWVLITWRYSVKKDPNSVFNKCLMKNWQTASGRENKLIRWNSI